MYLSSGPLAFMSPYWPFCLPSGPFVSLVAFCLPNDPFDSLEAFLAP